MPARILQIMLLIALLFAPIGMVSGSTAIAMPSAGSAGEHHAMTVKAEHCADMGQQPANEQDTEADLDCRATCSGVLTQLPVLRTSLAVASVPQTMAVAAAAPGISPAAEPRPPRSF